ncbi:hypothetical protein POTOM_002129 [Populus tomentosa]|uniref:hydroxymethylglutaryl-CoA lyase n=1 Tax=Populus tomentosa TaxID=118781 RepID=A0A8X8IX94_POPTO|nr:hypothetical protein POTOM_002129 [Populus tomentosa]
MISSRLVLLYLPLPLIASNLNKKLEKFHELELSLFKIHHQTQKPRFIHPNSLLHYKLSNTPSFKKYQTFKEQKSKRWGGGADAAQLKQNWLDSLTFPLPDETETTNLGGDDLTGNNAGTVWVIGIDPDVSGALALLKIDESGCSAQVFDSPHLKVMVGKGIPKRLDVKSIVQLIRSFDAPIVTFLYSSPIIESAVLDKVVKIVEAGPRDGLNNEKNIVPTDVKVELIHRLVSSRLPIAEATSFVSPRWVPLPLQNVLMFKEMEALPLLLYQTPMVLDCLISFIVTKLHIFFIISRCKRCEGSELPVLTPIFVFCLHVHVRAFVPMLEVVMAVVPVEKLSVHFHDTYGQYLPNIYVSLQVGISTVDSSIAGLGGCPYAKGASGNVATEDVVYMLHGLGVITNVDLVKLLSAGDFICMDLGCPSGSKTAVALSQVTADASKI